MAETRWPRALREHDAAEYTGLSTSTFRMLVKASDIPPPVLLSKRLPVWYRERLDAWLDAKAGIAAPSPESDAAQEWDALLGGTGGPALS